MIKDQYDLERFIDAQNLNNTYQEALREVKNGKKTTHWIWYIFPVLKGIGGSSTAKKYAITGEGEASAYLTNETLGPRLHQISDALYQVNNKSAKDIFGSTDAYKVHNCMTLFYLVAEDNKVYDDVLKKYYHGKLSDKTKRILLQAREKPEQKKY